MVEERDRQHPAFNSRAQASPAGIRPDAIATADLPTLTLGISTVPTSCEHCGSRFLNMEPPLGEHQRGMVTCGRCSRQACWLAAPMVAPVVRMHNARVTPPPPAPRDAVVTPILRSVISGRFHRGAGCSRACSVAYGHDAESHELYGRAMALAELAARPSGTVRTGPLTIDFDTEEVWIDGADLRLTPTEAAILRYLAERLGLLCLYVNISDAVWDRAMVETWASRLGPDRDPWHVLRVVVARMRGKLGSARRLIETVPTRGYRLRIEPPAEIGGGP